MYFQEINENYNFIINFKPKLDSQSIYFLFFLLILKELKTIYKIVKLLKKYTIDYI